MADYWQIRNSRRRINIEDSPARAAQNAVKDGAAPL